MNTLLGPSAEMAANVPGHWQSTPSNRILLVDDEAGLRRLSAQVLVRSGFQVDTAEDGQAGWEVLRTDSYDLLITDNNMPGLSGVELVRKLRSAQMRLPVILALGTLHTEDLNRNRWLNIAATLLKPFTTDRLLETVEEVLSVAGAVRSRSGVPALYEVQDFGARPSYRWWGINE